MKSSSRSFTSGCATRFNEAPTHCTACQCCPPSGPPACGPAKPVPRRGLGWNGVLPSVRPHVHSPRGVVVKAFKIPESVLVVIHTLQREVLLLARADHADFWQSVTGSRDTPGEPLLQTARREVLEETGLAGDDDQWRDWGFSNIYAIYPVWRHRYAPGITHNTEHVFGLCLPERCTPTLNPREHTAWRWLSWREAADQCFSPSNAEAILMLPRFTSV